MNTKILSGFVLLVSALIAHAAPWTLTSSTSVGTSTVPLNRPAAPLVPQTMVIIDPFTVNAEVRKVSAVAGSTLTTLTALKKAHSSGAQVHIVMGESVTTSAYGATGNGTTDDAIAIQAALDDQSAYGGALWIDGQNKSHRTSLPILGSSVCKLRHCSLLNTAGYAPIESNNAMLMPIQGNILTFTADATDVITTPSAHGIPSDDILVSFRGASLPAGIVAGRIYYSRDRTATTLKVSATIGGTALNITGSGSGTIYCEINSLSRMYLNDVYISGGDLAGMNGINANIQQPAEWRKVRVDNCPGFGIKLQGQDSYLDNIMSINCGIALWMDAASFFKIYAINFEQCATAIYMTTNNAANLISGVHVEMNAGVGLTTDTSTIFDIEACRGLIMDSVWITHSHDTQTVFHFDNISTSYSLRGVYINGATNSVMIDDDFRGISLRSWDDFRSNLMEFHAPNIPTSFLYEDHAQFTVVGIDGRVTKFGSVINAKPNATLQGGTSQTGDLLELNNVSGAKKSRVVVTGGFATSLSTAPADGDIANGEVHMWVTPTNGAMTLNFKGKETGGTVRAWSFAPGAYTP